VGRDCRQSRRHRLSHPRQFSTSEYELRNIHLGFMRHMLQSFSVGGMWTHSKSFYDRHNPMEFGKATFSLLGQLLQQLPNQLFSVRGYAETWRHSRAINSLCNYGGIDMEKLLLPCSGGGDVLQTNTPTHKICVATRALFTFVQDSFEFHSLPSSSDMAHLYIHASEQSRQDVVLSQV
jgi:hypothetical protein